MPRALGMILAVALALRLVAALAWAPEPVADAADYERLAEGLVAGEGYVDVTGAPTAWRPPGYAVFVAGIYAAFGGRRTAVRLAQAVVGTATVALTFLLARGFLGPPGGLVAAAFVALDPAEIFGVSRLLSEVLFGALLLGGVLLLVHAREDTRGRGLVWGGAAGVVLAWATLVRGALLLFPVALVPVWLAAPRGRRAVLGAILVGYVLGLAPWTARNARALDAFVPVATQGGMTLYSGNVPVDGWRFGILPSDETTRAAERLSEPEASAALTRAAVDHLREHPGTVPRLLALKVVFFWVPLDWEILPWQGVLNPVYLLALLLAAGWLVGGLRRRPGWRAVAESWPVWLPVAYMFALALVFYGSPRFRMPVQPFLAVAAAAAVVELAWRLGPERAARRVAGLALAVAVLAVAAEPLKAAARWVVGVGP